jgi:hypothetical protein
MPLYDRDMDRMEMRKMIARREAQRVANLTPQEKIFLARQRENSYIHRPLNTGWAVAAPGPLSPIGKEFQKIVLARDWDALFNYLPIKYWKRLDTLGKYSFKDVNGRRVYIPFTKDEVTRYVFSPYYSIQPGYVCSDAQRQLGVNANMKGMNRHGQKFGKNDPRVIWPIHPGWGYGSQRYGCEKPKKSTWVKIRHKVAAAAVIVAAVYLGPAIVAKVKTVLGGAAGGGTGATATSTVTQATTFQKVQAGTKTLLGYVNKARTIEAVVKGELPPPPIGIPGTSFRDWAFIVAKEEIKKEAIDIAMEAGQKYIAKKMTAREEAKLKAEIAEMQKQLIKLTPPEVRNMPVEPPKELPAAIKKIQVIEEKKKSDLNKFILPGLMVAGALILGG